MHTSKASFPLVLVSLSLALAPTLSLAQGAGTPPAGGDRNLAALAASLQVSEDQFAACFPAAGPGQQGDGPPPSQSGQSPAPGKGNPPADGQQPPAGPGGGMQAELLACLQKSNPALTADQLMAAMQASRPQPPSGGAPESPRP